MIVVEPLTKVKDYLKSAEDFYQRKVQKFEEGAY
jgi:hypothetical protein